jgi:RimJ/RimL family protein N-acetyltransferase
MFGSGAFGWPEHLEFLRNYFGAGNDDRWFVIERGGVAIGAVALYGFSADGRTCEWGRFIIDSEFQGRGYGRLALKVLLDHARDLGIEQIYCRVRRENARALHLYRSMGFQENGTSEDGLICLSARLRGPRG